MKAGRSALFERVGDFYRHHGTARRRSASITIAICRAVRKRTCCPAAGAQMAGTPRSGGIEAEIRRPSQAGMNRYEIPCVLRETREAVPSPITI